MAEKVYRLHVMVCAGSDCITNRSFEVLEALEKEIKKHNLEDEVLVVTTGCNGFCGQGPIIIVRPDEIFYERVTKEDVPFLVEEHFLKGRPVKKLMYKPPEAEPIPILKDIKFFGKQILIAMRNRGMIDPDNIEDYIARDGYAALAKVLTEMTPEQIIEEIKASGLRGRGGAGFPTGVKWELARKAKGDVKYIICNADEGDPGAFMDRSIMEADPHSIIEGMIIGARAIGAKEGFIYVRNEYPLAREKLKRAIEQAREYGLLGEDILGTGFSFDIHLHRGAGAFVCGEETALMASIEGRPGEPRPRPPYPIEKGLWGKPTVINNVETWANVPVIILRGAKWFSKIGTETSKGTKVFSVVGKVRDTGLVEVPMGITLGEIIFDICGGIQKDRKFKAVQIGGPSGGCLSTQHLNYPIDYESLTGAGAIMGSGGLVVTDECTCMVDLAHYFLTFTKDESCGKCTPCREGIPRMLEILSRIKRGEGKMEDLDLLEELALIIKDTALCGLGKTAPNPVLTTLRYFRDEYIQHIKYKRCPAGVCVDLVSAPCHHTCPIDTDAATYIALIAHRRFKEAFEVIQMENPLPAVCGRVCHHPCEVKCRSGEIGEPISIRNLKRFVADYIYKKEGTVSVKSFPKKYDEKVAIIGSGPAGLMAGWNLAKLGYNVTIFEALPVPGGMLAWGIPPYRLPKDILQKEIDYIKKAGVEIKTNTTIGKDLTIDDLFSQGYKAVFIATGAWRNLKLGIPGEDVEGVIDPIDFLKEVNMNGKPKIGKKVVVVGGGNTAIDAARSAWRLGADVTILYRRTRTEMPAASEEVKAALEEGIQIKFLTTPVEVISENGKLTGLKCIRMSLGEFDKSGRRKPVPIEGSEYTIEADTLIPAIGQEPDLSFLKNLTNGNKLEISKWNTLVVNPDTFETNVPGIFAGGDVVSGPATVIEAMRAGKIAAESIHRYLRGESQERTYEPTKPVMEVPPVELTEEEMKDLKRPEMPCLQIEERKNNFKEVDLGYDVETAVREAKRCLRCDLQKK